MNSTALSPSQRKRVEAAYPMVDRLAAMMSTKLRRVARDELQSIGYEALVRCGLRYEPDMGCTFRTYAYHRVRGAMLDESRRLHPGLRRQLRAMRVLEATQALLEEATADTEGDGPDPRTLEERVATAAELLQAATTTVLLAHGKGPDPEAVADPEAEDELDTALDHAKLRAMLNTLLGTHCNEDERDLIHALYTRGLSLQEVATERGRSRSTICRRHARLLRRLGKHLRPDTS